MFKKLQDLLEKWSSRKTAIIVIVVSIAFSEIIVITSDLLIQRSLVPQAIIRAFFISAGISAFMTLTYSKFMERLRLAEAALRKSEAENRAILQALPDMLFRLSVDGRFLQYHTAHPNNLWRLSDQLIGKSVYEVFPLEFADRVMGYIAEAVRTQEMQQYEYQLPYGDTPRYFEARMVRCDGDSVLTIIRDITAQKSAEAALKAERESLTRRVEERTAALQAANVQILHALQTRDEFLANINHELRTPLTPILAFADLLHNEHYGLLNDRQRQVAANIKESAQHLAELLNDVLDFSDFKSGQLRLKIEPVGVEEICQASLRQIEPAAHGKGLTITTTFDSAVSTIQADAKRLKKILDNLLNNAVKFTPKDGTVGLEVKGDKSTHTAHFTVWDTGIGIAEANIASLFQPFTQLEASITREHGGSGLGLAFVRYLVEMHGGAITVESQIGQGSRFTVSLPWHISMSDSMETPLIPFESPAAASHPNNKTLILVVEDNAMNRKVFCQMLNLAGYRTITAPDGATAIDAARTHQPSLILMDIQMPGMNGVEATRRIRSDAELQAIPIIAVTALTMPGDRERCMAAGANEYVSKPMDMKQLLKIIGQILSSSNSTATVSVPTPPAPG